MKISRRTSKIIGLGLSLLFLGAMNYISAAGVPELTPEVNITVNAVATAKNNESIWMLPGPRSLDPAIFGTPSDPLKTNWLPTSMRNTTDDNSAYTTTSDMTPFSNKTMPITGSVSINVTDKTKFDSPSSMDMGSVSANFTDPTGRTDYYVVMESLIPVGPDHPFFGGVGLNTYMHGATEIGTPLMPGGISYVTLWGFGDLYINGTLTDSKRVIHVMVSERMRTPDFKLGFSVQDPEGLEIHFIMPNTKVGPSGPFDDDVPTKFTLPNGMDQPFFHINFYNMNITRTSPTETVTVTTTETGAITTVTGDTSTEISTVFSTETETTPGFSTLITLLGIVVLVPLYQYYRKKNR